MPIVVVAADPDGAVAAALAGSEAVLGEPAAAETGPAGQMARGVELAAAEVTNTSAALLWPARMAWVGPETVTSLIEAHGATPDAILRPTWHDEPGWPVLVPVVHLGALRAADPAASLDEAVAALVAALVERRLDLGDPGVTTDGDTPLDELPAYEGPAAPAADHDHEWGADVEREAGLVSPDLG